MLRNYCLISIDNLGMKIVFTICSNNYLAQAKVLVDSFFEHNNSSDYNFIIGLCDRKSTLINYDDYSNCTIVVIEDLNIPNFEQMYLNYNIIELNTSIKPYFFSYVFNEFNPELVFYIDPDICIYDSFSVVESEMSQHDILLTPHIFTPIPLDGHIPQENVFLNYGLYNLGFLGLRKSSVTFQLLKWWSAQLQSNCINNPAEGYFVDQLPMNHVPVFFDRVLVSRNYGLNVAYWNLHERQISKKNDIYKVNNTTDLVFFHFSNYNPKKDTLISPSFTRFAMSEYPIILDLYSAYHDKLLQNNFLKIANVPCYFVVLREEYIGRCNYEKLKKEFFLKKIMRLVKKILPNVINDCVLRYSKL